MRFGVISDTHGRLDPKVPKAFAGVDRIFHGGDIGSEAVLDALQQIAPVTAIRGNNDRGTSLERLPELEIWEVNGRAILMIEAPRRKQRGIFDPKGETSICIRASNPRPKGAGNATRVRVHDLKDYFNPTEEIRRQLRGVDPDVILSGHSHKGVIAQEGEVIYFNPGGAGPKRFSLKRSIGLMEWGEEILRLKLIFLEGRRSVSRSLPLRTRPSRSKLRHQSPSPRR